MVTLELVETPPPPSAPADDRETSSETSMPSPAARVAPASPRSRATALVAPRVPESTLPAPDDLPSACAPSCPAPPRPVPLVAIDPRSAALSAFSIDELSAPRARPTGRSAVRADRGAELAAGLRATIATPPYLSHRPAPALRRMRDGRLRWDGPRFTAFVRDDGSVQFSDRGPIEVDAPFHQAGAILSGTFDLGEAIMQANGQDPLSAERAWFMRETQAERDRLADRFARAAEVSGMRRLAARLERVMLDPALDARGRRRAIFQLWDDCDTNAMGAQARAMVVTFVRERLPAGTALAFSASELRSFNATRISPVAFDPYRDATPDAGASG